MIFTGVVFVLMVIFLPDGLVGRLGGSGCARDRASRDSRARARLRSAPGRGRSQPRRGAGRGPRDHRPNGAGKTTLFHLISGLLAPTSGRVLFRGDDVTALPAPARCRRGISRTFQITSIFPELSVLENVRIAVQLRAGQFPARRRSDHPRDSEERARASLDSLGLLARAAEPASTLPHGDQRLLEIAMAVAQEPALLLLDEPTQGLSPEDTVATVAVIRQVARRQKLTILLVEHDMDVVFDLADRISVLHFGQLIAEGTPDQIRANADVQLAYLGAASDAACRRGAPDLLRQEPRAARRLLHRPRRPDHRAPRAQRRGQDDDPALHHGLDPASRARCASRTATSPDTHRTRSSTPDRLRPRGSPDLPSSRSRREPPPRRTSRRGDAGWTRERIFTYFPVLQERWRQRGRSLSRRRAADARHRPCSRRQSRAAHAGRALARPGPRLVRELESLMLRLKAGGVTILLVEQNARWPSA